MGFHIKAIITNHYHDRQKRRAEREQHVSYGSAHPDKTFYVIRRNYGYIGLFSIFITHLGRIKYALERGYIPVIDMQNYPNLYLEDDEIGRVNAWEYYYHQPTEYNMEDVMQAKNVILSDMGIPEDRPTDDTEMLYNEKGVLEQWRELSAKYARVQESILEASKKDWAHLFPNGERVLGVSVRGTDYAKLKPADHPIQPTVEQAVAKAKDSFQERPYDSILLSTEDIGFVTAFKEAFGDRVKCFDKEFVSYKEGIVADTVNVRKGERCLSGEEYFREKLLLCYCQDVLISRTSGTVAMACLSPSWENVFVFDYGRYPKR